VILLVNMGKKPDREPNHNEKQLLWEMTRTDLDRPRSAVEAFERVYASNGTRKTTTNTVYKIMQRPHMQKAKADIEARIEADRRRASRGTAQAIQTALWKEADSADRSSDRIAALRALSSLVPKDSTGDPLADSASSKLELQARLEEILSSVPDAIDVSPEASVIEDGDTQLIEAEVIPDPDSDPDY